MHIQSFPNPDMTALRDFIREKDKDTSVKTILVLSCDENNAATEEWDSLLKNTETTIFGGIFPKIFHYHELMNQGHVVALLSDEFDVQVIDDISSSPGSIDEQVAKIDLQSETKSLYVLVDGLSTQIASLIESLYQNWGLENNYIGGGAGSLSFEMKPCLFTNQGIIQNACVIACSQKESKVGVAHGWKRISEPLRFTDVDKTKIISLDFEPAFDVYKKVIEEYSGQEITKDNFFDIAKSFPFGISINGEENIVRDPIILEEKSIVCVGEVPAESYVHILNGVEEDLVNAAEQANKLSRFRNGNFKLCFDCISRALFMGENFKKELVKISDGDENTIGVLSIGEIANNGEAYLEFYNKTCVVSTLEAA